MDYACFQLNYRVNCFFPSDDIETGLARESLTQKEDAAEEAVARPEEPLISQGDFKMKYFFLKLFYENNLIW